MFAKIARGKFQIPPSSGLSMDAKILLRSLIRLKPDERLLPNEILMHNWLKETCDSDYAQMQQNKLKNLKSAQHYLNNLNANTNILLNSSNLFNHHKPLGISRSSPLTPTTVLSSNFGKSTALGKCNDVDDRMVPEFKFSPTNKSEQDTTITSLN